MSGRFYVTTPIYYVSASPRGHGLHHRRGRRARALPPPPRRRDLLSLTGTDEHGLKLQTEAEKGMTRRPSSTRCPSASGALLPKLLPDARRFHPHDAGPPRGARPALVDALPRSRDIYPARGRALLRRLRGDVHREGTPSGGLLPRPRAARRARAGGVVLLPHEPLRRPAARVTSAARRRCGRRRDSTRWCRSSRAACATCRSPAPASPGASRAGRPEARDVRVVRRALQLPHGGGRPGRAGALAARRSSWARTSCASTRCTGRRS